MAKLTATITAKQLAGWTSEMNRYNAEQTAAYAARNPPEVFTPVDVDGMASIRRAEVGDSYASQASEEELKSIVSAFRDGNQAKRQAIKDAAK